MDPCIFWSFVGIGFLLLGRIFIALFNDTLDGDIRNLFGSSKNKPKLPKQNTIGTPTYRWMEHTDLIIDSFPWKGKDDKYTDCQEYHCSMEYMFRYNEFYKRDWPSSDIIIKSFYPYSIDSPYYASLAKEREDVSPALVMRSDAIVVHPGLTNVYEELMEKLSNVEIYFYIVQVGDSKNDYVYILKIEHYYQHITITNPSDQAMQSLINYCTGILVVESNHYKDGEIAYGRKRGKRLVVFDMNYLTVENFLKKMELFEDKF